MFGTLLSLILATSILLLYLALASGRVVAWLTDRAGQSYRVFVPLLGLWGIASSYGFLSGQLSVVSSLQLLLYLVLPVFWALVDRRQVGSSVTASPTLILAILCLWLPIEFHWIPRMWFPPGGRIPLQGIVAVVCGLYAFLVVRQLPGVGYVFRLKWTELRLSLVQFALFMGFFAIPLGISLKFVSSTSDPSNPAFWPFQLIGIFFLIALPEEFLFRGVIQNLLQRSLGGSVWVPLVVSAVIFGLAHANNASPPYLEISLGDLSYAFPWVYVVLASIAGIFYGLTYIRTGKITAAALVHCLVDTWWSIFFQG